MFATCSIAFMLLSPVDRMLGAATACGKASRSRVITAPIRPAGSAATWRNRFTIVMRMRLGSGQPSEYG